jgi:hypothetical protein
LGCSRIGVALRRGYIDSTPYDTTSILKLITVRFGLEPLPGVREWTGDLTAAWPRHDEHRRTLRAGLGFLDRALSGISA